MIGSVQNNQGIGFLPLHAAGASAGGPGASARSAFAGAPGLAADSLKTGVTAAAREIGNGRSVGVLAGGATLIGGFQERFAGGRAAQSFANAA